MKNKLLFTIGLLFTLFTGRLYAQTVDVTFSVDMKNVEAYDKVFITGDVTGWSNQEITAPASGSIYTVTLTLDAATNVYTYRFVAKNGDSEIWEPVPAECIQWDNRWFETPAENATLQTVCFGECAPCAASSVYTIGSTVTPDASGTVSGTGDFEENTDITLTATPNDGYRFVQWKLGDTQVGTSSELAVKVTENQTYEAVFILASDLPKYVITTEVTPENSGEVTGAGEYIEGDEATISATAKDGFVFVEWKQGDESITTETDYTFNVTEAQTFTAVFVSESNTREVTLQSSSEEAGTVSGEGQFASGSDVTVLAEANDDYAFLYWMAGEDIVSYAAEYTFTLDNDITLIAHFIAVEEAEFVEVSSNSVPMYGGTIEGAKEYIVNTEATLIATAKDGYSFVNWTVDGEEVSTEVEYSFIVTEEITVEANFESITGNYFNISAGLEPADGGKILGLGEYAENATAVLEAKSGIGFDFVKWTKGGEDVSTEAVYAFTVTADVDDIVAHFVSNIPENAISVTFQVDMKGQEYEKIAITGDVTEWGKFGIMEKTGDGEIHAITLQLDPTKEVYAYRFVTMTEDEEEDLWETVPGDCNFWEEHRPFTPNNATSDIVLDVICFGECTSCSDSTNPSGPTSVEDGLDDIKIVAYPNPVESNLTLKGFNTTNEYSVYVYSSEGRLLHKQTVLGQELTTIDFTKFNQGIYHVVINSKDQHKVVKILK
ncbi:InlB B-repeat-containing protein [Flammeovirga yaeyamensis]|uniref:InlB B-repeat-containing protein n=1 Tax=Flammeovirga yaeyamensis TaxID=367791 RepID=A0AAX1NAX7_9BACT|nr:T9SS type A sorting domain-containing protein [Flammeovirga yaeyamensis]MBB3697813.1 hypothetical protein [Flammeovirga yaeyamensis]NMF35831.1 T9SS type A sorting domain-containing protein [Flammeovirga yaeyamensis]QWG03217.1 InlB B-repeat-containing protein [Flammeovirga yaeyamensis]